MFPGATGMRVAFGAAAGACVACCAGNPFAGCVSTSKSAHQLSESCSSFVSFPDFQNLRSDVLLPVCRSVGDLFFLGMAILLEFLQVRFELVVFLLLLFLQLCLLSHEVLGLYCLFFPAIFDCIERYRLVL